MKYIIYKFDKNKKIHSHIYTVGVESEAHRYVYHLSKIVGLEPFIVYGMVSGFKSFDDFLENKKAN